MGARTEDKLSAVCHYFFDTIDGPPIKEHFVFEPSLLFFRAELSDDDCCDAMKANEYDQTVSENTEQIARRICKLQITTLMYKLKPTARSFSFLIRIRKTLVKDGNLCKTTQQVRNKCTVKLLSNNQVSLCFSVFTNQFLQFFPLFFVQRDTFTSWLFLSRGLVKVVFSYIDVPFTSKLAHGCLLHAT